MMSHADITVIKTMNHVDLDYEIKALRLKSVFSHGEKMLVRWKVLTKYYCRDMTYNRLSMTYNNRSNLITNGLQ